MLEVASLPSLPVQMLPSPGGVGDGEGAWPSREGDFCACAISQGLGTKHFRHILGLGPGTALPTPALLRVSCLDSSLLPWDGGAKDTEPGARTRLPAAHGPCIVDPSTGLVQALPRPLLGPRGGPGGPGWHRSP